VLFHIDDASAGMQVKCRACGGLVRIPGLTPSPPGGAAPAAPQWYYTRNRQPIGPVSFAQLQQLAGSGQLDATDLVWQEGMPGWTPANTVVGLLGLLGAARPVAKPPPVPPPEVPAPPPSQPAAQPDDDDIADVIEVPDAPALDELEEVAPELLLEVEPKSAPAVEAASPEPAPAACPGPGGPDAWPDAPPRAARASDIEDQPIRVEAPFHLDWHDSPPSMPATLEFRSEETSHDEPIKESPDYDIVDDSPPAEPPAPVIPSLELDAPAPLGWEPEPSSEPDNPAAGPQPAPVPLPAEERQAGPDTYAVVYGDKTPTGSAPDRERAPVPLPAEERRAGPGKYAVDYGDKTPVPEARHRVDRDLEAEDFAPPAGAKSSSPKPPRPLTRREAEKKEEERLIRRSIAEARRAWRRVSLGINLIFYALCVWVVTWSLFILIANIASVASGQPAPPGGLPTIMGGSSTFLLLTAALVTCVGFLVDATSIVGYSFCLFVPQPKSARPLGIAALALAAFALLIAVAGQFVPLLLPVAALIGFVRWLIFLLFLRVVADYFDARGLKEDIDRLLIRAVVGIGIWVAAAIILIGITVQLAHDQQYGMAKIPLICAALSFLFLMASVSLRYLQVLRDSGAWIDERLYRGGGP
jgi:hypothetical protein